MLRNTVVALVPLLLSASAFADRGFELGAGAGLSLIRDTDSGETFQGNAFAYEFTVGYRFSERIAASVGYLDLGEASDTIGGVDTDISINALALALRYTFTPASSAQWYGRIGVVQYYSDVDPGGVGLDDIFGSGAIDVGLGVDITVSDAGAWFFEVRYLDGDDQEEGGAALLGYRHRF